jgi:hypothetical protein
VHGMMIGERRYGVDEAEKIVNNGWLFQKK